MRVGVDSKKAPSAGGYWLFADTEKGCIKDRSALGQQEVSWYQRVGMKKRRRRRER